MINFFTEKPIDSNYSNLSSILRKKTVLILHGPIEQILNHTSDNFLNNSKSLQFFQKNVLESGDPVKKSSDASHFYFKNHKPKKHLFALTHDRLSTDERLRRNKGRVKNSFSLFSIVNSGDSHASKIPETIINKIETKQDIEDHVFNTRGNMKILKFDFFEISSNPVQIVFITYLSQCYPCTVSKVVTKVEGENIEKVRTNIDLIKFFKTDTSIHSSKNLKVPKSNSVLNPVKRANRARKVKRDIKRFSDVLVNFPTMNKSVSVLKNISLQSRVSKNYPSSDSYSVFEEIFDSKLKLPEKSEELSASKNSETFLNRVEVLQFSAQRVCQKRPLTPDELDEKSVLERQAATLEFFEEFYAGLTQILLQLYIIIISLDGKTEYKALTGEIIASGLTLMSMMAAVRRKDDGILTGFLSIFGWMSIMIARSVAISLATTVIHSWMILVCIMHGVFISTWVTSIAIKSYYDESPSISFTFKRKIALFFVIFSVFGLPSLTYWPIMFELKKHKRPLIFLFILLVENILFVALWMFFDEKEVWAKHDYVLVFLSGGLYILGALFVLFYICCKPKYTDHVVYHDMKVRNADSFGMYFDFCDVAFKLTRKQEIETRLKEVREHRIVPR
ncbi:XK-related protein [Nephila pilipes]|uniref:XK-related protein n=1 Tax=Nephila pilipes TaxID=299642 RepID=A0A8X6MKY4_NEPPI|nr:XK-related protein [Nephila pilipes]